MKEIIIGSIVLFLFACLMLFLDCIDGPENPGRGGGNRF